MLRENGQWWHAAHHVGTSMQPGEPLSWQMAEALGSWTQVQIPGLDGGRCLPGIGLVCNNARWSSDGLGPTTGSRLRPNLSPDASMVAEVESAIDSGRHVLCFAVRRCSASGRAHLELQVGSRDGAASGTAPWGTLEDEFLPSVRMALFAQGFSRHYGKGAPVSDDGPPDGRPRPCSCGFGS